MSAYTKGASSSAGLLVRSAIDTGQTMSDAVIVPRQENGRSWLCRTARTFAIDTHPLPTHVDGVAVNSDLMALSGPRRCGTTNGANLLLLSGALEWSPGAFVIRQRVQ
jgi:hypothetical protein